MLCRVFPVDENRVQGAPRGRASQHIKASCAVLHGADHTSGFQYMETSLHKASEAGWHAVVQTLLEHGADVSAIDEVCFGARLASVRCPFSVSLSAMSVLMPARGGDCTTLEGAPPSDTCRKRLRPLSLWHSANDTPALQRERISLHWACIQGHSAVVQTLLAHGANVAAIDEVSGACGCCAAGVGAPMCRDCIQRRQSFMPHFWPVV